MNIENSHYWKKNLAALGQKSFLDKFMLYTAGKNERA